MQSIISSSTFRRLWLIVLLALFISGMAFALDVAAQETESPRVTVPTSPAFGIGHGVSAQRVAPVRQDQRAHRSASV